MPSSIVLVARPTCDMGMSGSPATAPGYQSDAKPSASARCACSIIWSTVAPPPFIPMRIAAPEVVGAVNLPARGR